MEISEESIDEIYEVEKIIARKIYKNKKYYLIKWLCFPISESTWEPKSNLKYLNYMMNKFEAEYPYSIDQYMYEIYNEECEKRLKRRKNGKNKKEAHKKEKLLSKKIKFEGFSKSELENEYYDKLKSHLHIYFNKKDTKNELIIDLAPDSQNTTESDDTISNFNENEEKKDFQGLIIPQID